MAAREQLIAQMRAEEARTARDQAGAHALIVLLRSVFALIVSPERGADLADDVVDHVARQHRAHGNREVRAARAPR